MVYEIHVRYLQKIWISFCQLPQVFQHEHVLIRVRVLFSADFSDSASEEDREARDSVYVMYAGQHSIFYAFAHDEDGFYRHLSKIPAGDWKNTSNHDSCWRSDGFSFLSKIFFDMATVVNDDKRPCDLSDYTNLGIGSNPVTKTQVMFRMQKDGYHKNIVKVL